MDTVENDALLKIGLIMTVLLMGLTLAVFTILLVMVPVTFFAPEWLFETSEISMQSTLAVAGLLLLAAIVTLGAFQFFRLLGRMIKSAGGEGAFSIENANRLSQMGWIALAFQLASFPIAALTAYLGKLLPEGNFSVDFDFSLTGLLLVIVLFILARIFRQGAQMREDLEGTV